MKKESPKSSGQIDPTIHHDGQGNIIPGPQPEYRPAKSTDRSFLNPNIVTVMFIIGIGIFAATQCLGRIQIDLAK